MKLAPLFFSPATWTRIKTTCRVISVLRVFLCIFSWCYLRSDSGLQLLLLQWPWVWICPTWLSCLSLLCLVIIKGRMSKMLWQFSSRHHVTAVGNHSNSYTLFTPGINMRFQWSHCNQIELDHLNVQVSKCTQDALRTNHLQRWTGMHCDHILLYPDTRA